MASLERSERLDLRVTPQFKKQVQQAASLASMSVSEYMISKIHQASLADIKDNRLAFWTEEEIDAAASLLESPLEPAISTISAALKNNEKKSNSSKLKPLKLKALP